LNCSKFFPRTGFLFCTLAIALNISSAHSKQAEPMAIASPAFKNGQTIPKQFTADGENVSPPLTWGSVPKGAKCMVLILEDPDAPGGTFTHWLIYNVPPSSSGLKQNIAKIPNLSDGSIQGTNSFGKIGYGGPSPPPGKAHRYFVRVYALDSKLSVPTQMRVEQLRQAISSHILGDGQLLGVYGR
jgi:Raf kinase inhibitor-like YbhB/YbcL family protein